MGVEGAGCHDVGREAGGLRPGGVDDLAGQEQAPGGALADQLGQQQGAGVGRGQADADLWRGEASAVGAHAQVTRRRELERAADAHAVDDGHDRHGRLQGGARQALEGGDDGLPLRTFGDGGGEEVVAGREVLACAARHDAAHGGVGPGGFDRVGQLLDHRSRPGVPAVLAVPAHHPGAAELGRGHGHRARSFLSRACASAGGSSSPRSSL